MIFDVVVSCDVIVIFLIFVYRMSRKKVILN